VPASWGGDDLFVFIVKCVRNAVSQAESELNLLPMNEKDYCQFLIRDSIRNFGWSSSGLVFVLIALILTSWLIYLIIRSRLFSDYVAFVAATFFPTTMGYFTTVLGMIQFLQRTSSGEGGPGPPFWQDFAYEDMCLSLIAGTSLTCLFLPFGLALLWVYKPKLPGD
jgi:hypothetical protein